MTTPTAPYTFAPYPHTVNCIEHGEDATCGLEGLDCHPDDGCSDCGAPLARLCGCDYAYESGRDAARGI